MTTVTEKTIHDPAAQFEDGVSVPAESPKPAQTTSPAAAPEDKDADSFGLVDTVQSFFGVEKPKSKRAETKHGPNNLPRSPAEPRDRTTPTVGLKGEALQKAQAKNAEAWGEYEKAYKQYLADFREAYKNCGTLEQLRQLQPEPPATTLRDVGFAASYEAALSRYNAMFKEKVDRGYELIGKTPPGTLTAIFGASLSAKVGALGASVDGKLQVDTRGEVKASKGAGESLQAGPVKLGTSSSGTQSVAVDAGIAKVKANSKGDGEVEVGLGAGSGSAFYNPSEGTYGGGVKVGRKYEVGMVAAGAEVSIKAQIQGMSKEDVKRVLSGWLVPVPEDVNAKWLQEQQLNF